MLALSNGHLPFLRLLCVSNRAAPPERDFEAKDWV